VETINQGEAAMSSFLSIHGQSVTLDDKPLMLRGVNIGNWMLIEHFMIGLPWTEYKMRRHFKEILGEEAYHRFFDTYMECFFTDADAKFLADTGVNYIRLPFNYRHFEDDLKPGHFKTDGFKYFDQAISACRKHGIYVLLDLHAAAGVQARDWNAESVYGEAFLWDHPHFRQRTADLWKHIARRYKEDPQVMGYEILNEPLSPDLDSFHAFNMACIKAIREEDTRHIIVVESNEWGKKIATLRPEIYEDALVMPSLHHYPRQFKPFDRITEYPCDFEGRRIDRTALFDTMKDAYDPSLDRPFFCGEFNHGNLAVFDDLLSIFEEHRVHWTMWSYKSLMMGLVSPAETTPWKKFQADEKVRAAREGFNKYSAGFVEELKKNVALVTEGDIRHVIGQSLHQWHGVTLPRVLTYLKEKYSDDLEGMARSFALANCTVDEKKQDVFKKYCLQ